MYLFHNIRKAIQVFREDGFYTLIVIIKQKYKLPIPLNSRFYWKAGVQSEKRFWDHYFQTKGSRWSHLYQLRLEPDLPLQPRAVALLPPQSDICILDVGAGPLTVLGKKCTGKRISITAIDPLADEYNRILDKYHIQPIVRTQKLDAERLTEKFPSNTFDLVFACNSIDHTYDPEKAILQMINVTKKGCYILLDHGLDEAEHENYAGFHQWNFSMSANGDFLIRSRSEQVNMSLKYAEVCTITCELVNNTRLITSIQKK